MSQPTHYAEQVAKVRQLGTQLSSPGGHLLPVADWSTQYGRYREEVEVLAELAAEIRPDAVRACWKCGGITVPEPNRKGRWCPDCAAQAEEVPHPADCVETERLDAIVANSPVPMTLVRDLRRGL